jgi:hypothetical protein
MVIIRLRLAPNKRLLIGINYLINYNNVNSNINNMENNNNNMDDTIILSEIWKPVLELDSLYEISNYGRLKTKSRIVQRKNGTCYTIPETIQTRSYILNSNGKRYYNNSKDIRFNNTIIRVNLLLLTAKYFLPNPTNCTKVKIIQGNDIISVNNIQWVSTVKKVKPIVTIKIKNIKYLGHSFKVSSDYKFYYKDIELKQTKHNTLNSIITVRNIDYNLQIKTITLYQLAFKTKKI